MKCSIFRSLFARAVLFPGVAVVSVAMSEVGIARAQTSEQATTPALVPVEPDRHSHRGFYVGLKLGGGYRAFTGGGYSDAAIEDWSMKGGGLAVDVSIGGAVVENLIIHGDLVSSLATNPTLEAGDRSMDTEETTARMIGFGAGVTYFIMPLNVYVAGSLLASSVNVEYKGEQIADSALGFGGTIQAGKQFWIGPEWAIDVGPSFHVATMNEKGDDGHIVGWALSLLAGVSYN
jgi:hypothetical protein